MTSMPAPLLLLDGASMWFRSYFGVPSSITSPDGRPVNALRGFLDTVATLITKERPARIASPSPSRTVSPTSRKSPTSSPRIST